MTSYTQCRLLVLCGLISITVVGLETYNGLPGRILRWHQAPKENTLQEAVIPQGIASHPWYRWETKDLKQFPSDVSRMTDGVSLCVGHDPQGPLEVESSRFGQIPVYLINDTDLSLSVPCQDGDIYLKLEARQPDGSWRRAQSHQHSGCGNSYMQLELPAHHFVCIKGYKPMSGKRAMMRYAIHNGAQDMLTTDEFDGVCSADDLALSEFDDMALSEADLPLLRSFLLREKVPSLIHYERRLEELRSYAWHSLMSGRHESAPALSVAKEVWAYDPTLHRFSLSLEESLQNGKALRDKIESSQKRIHGFHIKDELAQAHAK